MSFGAAATGTLPKGEGVKNLKPMLVTLAIALVAIKISNSVPFVSKLVK